MKLIARIFAETLVKPIFLGILKFLTAGDMEPPLAFRLRGQFVQYDQRVARSIRHDRQCRSWDWRQTAATGCFRQSATDADGPCSVAVWSTYDPAAEHHNTVSKMVELGGQKNVNDFILNPQGQPVPQSGPHPQLMLE